MLESRSQQHPRFSKFFALFRAVAPIRSDATARGRKVLVWLIVVAAVFAQAPRMAAGPLPFTTTTLTVSSGSVTAGAVTTLTATVTQTMPIGPVITNVTLGQVVFCNATAAYCDGAAVIGTAQMTASGVARLKVILGVGTYSIKAVFQGFAGTPTSSSAAQAVTVTANSNYVSSTALGFSGTPGDYTLTGTVTAFGRATATGTVSFVDTTDGNAVIGLEPLNAATLATVYVEAPQSPINVGDGVGFVATGDFNNDGIPDVAWVNNEGVPKVYVSLGAGDGSFNSPTSIGLANQAAMLAVADVNGDGVPDLLVPNSYGGNTVNVLLGNGDGTFQPAQTFFTGTQPIFVAVGDFNGDGIPDLAVVNRGTNTVSTLLGVGDGTFGTAVPITVGSAPTGLVAGDFNNDGVLDLAVTNINDNDVGILIGVGDGTFAAQTTLALPNGSYPYWLATGDLRSSGVLDLVVPASGSTNVYVLLGNNDGTFQPAVAYPVGDAAQGVALGDFNGDGILDLVSADSGEDGIVSVLLGVGDGTFLAKNDYTVGNRPANVVVADFNGDGMLDLADSDVQDATVTVLLQAQTQTAIATGVSAPGTGLQVTDAYYRGDVERAPSTSPSIPLNGNPATSTTNTTLTAAPNPVISGAATTLTASISPIPTGCLPLGSVSFYTGATLLGTGTVNASGVATLLLSDLAPGSYSVTAEYSGDVAGLSGSFSTPVLLRVTSSAMATVNLALSAASVVNGTATTMTATVLNGISQVASGTVTFCDATATYCEGAAILGTASLSSSGTAVLKLIFGVGSYSIKAVFSADDALQGAASAAQPLTVTGNGLLATGSRLMESGSVGNYTLVNQIRAFGSAPLLGTISFLDASNGNAQVATAALNTATLAYAFTTLSAAITNDADLGNIVTGDFNNDGILDFALINNAGAAEVSVFIGNGDGTFHSEVNYALPSYSTDLKAADFNGDGKLDLVAASPCDCEISTVSVLLGNGDGTFQTQTPFNVGSGVLSVAVGDFNGDGIPDLATANSEGSNISILLGRGDGTFQAQVQYPAGNGPFYAAVGDYNGDGALDLAVVNLEDATVSVLLGNGDGTFQSQVTYPVGNGPGYVLAVDTNNDGKLDLVTANQDDNTISVLLGNGDGTFQPQVTYATGVDPSDLAAADFNQDGKLDLAVTNAGSGTVGILHGNGDGTFQPQLTVAFGDSTPYGIATGDFNGDGLSDFVESSSNSGGANVALGFKTETATATAVALSGAGTHNVDASYPGDASRMANLSNIVALTGTGLPATTTTLAPSPNPATSGQTVTLTASISPTPTGAPLGSVSFYNGATLLGMGTVSVSGVATFSTSALPVGSDTLTAVYSGNITFATSTSPAVIETVALAATTTTLSYSPNPAVDGQSETFTATVAPAPTGSTPGTVSFYNGATLLGTGTLNSAGVATFTTSTLPVGNLTITAVYSGNGTFATSTSSVSVVTEMPGFTVVAPAGPITALQGTLITIPLSVPPLGGAFNNVVTMSVTGLPPGAVAVFTPPSVTPGTAGEPTTLTIQLASGAAAIPFTEHHIPAWPGFALALGVCLLCGVLVLRRGVPRNARVAFACTGLAAVALLIAGCNGGFSSPPVTPAGSYVLTITGTSGAVRSSATLTIIVK